MFMIKKILTIGLITGTFLFASQKTNSNKIDMCSLKVQINQKILLPKDWQKIDNVKYTNISYKVFEKYTTSPIYQDCVIYIKSSGEFDDKPNGIVKKLKKKLVSDNFIMPPKKFLNTQFKISKIVFKNGKSYTVKTYKRFKTLLSPAKRYKILFFDSIYENNKIKVQITEFHNKNTFTMYVTIKPKDLKEYRLPFMQKAQEDLEKRKQLMNFNEKYELKSTSKPEKKIIWK